MTARTSLTPAVTAESSTNRRPVARLTRWASVVLPVPGGPQRITEIGDDRAGRHRSDQPPQRRSGRQQVVLADHLVERRGRIRTASGPPPRSSAADVEEVRARSCRACSPRGVGSSTPGRSRRRPPRAAPAVIGVGAPVSGSPPDAVFGNAITSRIDVGAGEQRHDPVQPEGDAAVRRRAVLEGLQQEAELALGLLASRARCTSNTRCWTSARWIRIEPPPISLPLSTMS